MEDLTSARVLADSTYLNGTRLITLEATFPRIILAEVNTHRMLSRNSASSRAIPVDKQIARVMAQPFVPIKFPRNGAGMSPEGYWEPGTQEHFAAEYYWLSARNAAVNQVRSLLDMSSVHKQITNRLLEPFMWHTAILTATEPAWAGVFNLRCHPDAQFEFQLAAIKMREAIFDSTPTQLTWGEWHLPLMGFPGDEFLSLNEKIKVSVGRCARVSYLTHDGVRDVGKDIELFDRLHNDGHLSPFEHVAEPSFNPVHWANFAGWRQARQFVESGETLPGVVGLPAQV